MKYSIVQIISAMFMMLVWVICSNNYFGWNMYPQSDVEMICDGITFLGALLIIFSAKGGE